MNAEPVTTAALCRLFAKVLNLDSIRPDTDFYMAGGHSLAALELAVAIEAESGLRVGVVDILDCPTPQALAARLGLPGRGTAAAAPPASAGAVVGGLGHEGRWLWLERQRTGLLSDAYSVSCLLDGHGDVDPDGFARAVAVAVRQHPALCCVIREVDGEPRVDMVEPRGFFDVLRSPEHDIERLAAVAFDPAVGPLLRIRLLLGSGPSWQVLIVADHLVCDGRSLEILARDIVDAYGATARDYPDAPIPDAVAAPAAPARVTESARKAALDYWLDRLTPPPPTLPLPVAAPREGPVGSASALVTRDVPAAAVLALAKAGHPSLFVPAAAAVVRTLTNLAGLRDVCVGTAVDRRARTGTEGVVGCLVTTVPVRVRVPVANHPDALMAAVSAAAAEAVDHCDVSFDEIVAAVNPPRPPGRTPLFDVWVAVFPPVDAPSAGPGGIALHGSSLPVRSAVFELSFQFVRHAAGMRLALLYDATRYDQDTVDRIADRTVAAMVAITDGVEADGDGAALEPAPTLFSGFRLEA
ncbi:condensation domain-containing protein [Nocardiopsis sp. NPDC006198]|uniref:condensation domain-containing protein n=1 Tax=Nocardiopsis sp. NPDC006198 TaxID=3154472 RepID=UPI0033A56A8B